MPNKIKRVLSDLPKGSDFYIERREVRAGEHFPPHWHDYFEFELVTEGRGEHIYNNTRYTLERGSAYLMSYYDFHELYAETDMILLKIQFNEHILPPEMNEFIFLSRNRFCAAFDTPTTDSIVERFELIGREMSEHLTFSDTVIKNTIASVIVDTLRNSTQMAQNFPSLLQKAVAHIRNHFREDISLSELSERLGVTPNYLGMLFSKHLGVSFSDYLNTVRLRGACNLLTHTDLSVKEIGLSSGYNSFEHFEYTFKKKLDCTPLEFRRGNRDR